MSQSSEAMQNRLPVSREVVIVLVAFAAFNWILWSMSGLVPWPSEILDWVIGVL